MSYEAMHKVRASGLSDRTQVDVLEALAFFLNKETGACFPSTEAISRISRVNDRLVRTTLKTLHSLGLISSTQKAGQKRYFTLHLDRLPLPIPLQEVTGGQENAGGEESTPLYENTPLQESTGEGCRKIQGTPVGKCSTPLYETTPEQGINKESNKEEEQGIGTGSVAPSPDHFPDATKKIEEPKPKRTTTDRGSRLTITELPDDWKAFAEQEEPDLDPKRLFENFKDYWNGLSGAKAIKKDWKGTWRNFVRSFHNAEDWKRRPMLKRAPTHSSSRPGQFVEKKQSERDYFDW
nr:MAG TPA: helix-turn-helix domain protein [Caudoviricetes sp.]